MTNAKICGIIQNEAVISFFDGGFIVHMMIFAPFMQTKLNLFDKPIVF